MIGYCSAELSLTETTSRRERLASERAHRDGEMVPESDGHLILDVVLNVEH